MSLFPPKKQPETKHPIIKEYEDLLNKSNLPREAWDELFLDFYQKNHNSIHDIENFETDHEITRVIGVLIIYSRIIDNEDNHEDGILIAEYLEALLSKLNENSYNYQETYLNAKTWIEIHFSNNKKHKRSKKVLSEIAQLDKSSASHKKKLVEEIKRPLSKFITIVNAILFFIAMTHILIAPLPIGFIIIVLILFTLFLGASLYLDKIAAYFVNKKYK